MGVAVRMEGLTKRFEQRGAEVTAVDHLTLEVQEGEIFGFLGPNGAGKTTTIKILLGLIFPNEGSAEVLGRPAGDLEMRRQISYLPESPYFYDYLTGAELLDFYGRLFHIPEKERKERVDHLLELVGLAGDRAKQLKQYSKGMLQRIGIAQALINDPKLLFLDEPTSGLDPVAHIEIRRLIENLRDQGKTVFLSSHQLSDVELVCDRIAILNYGRLVRTGKVSELVTGRDVEVRARVSDTTAERLRQRFPNLRLHDGIAVVNEVPADSVNDVVDIIRAGQGELLSVVPQRQTLEDVFVEAVGMTRRAIGTFNPLSEGART